MRDREFAGLRILTPKDSREGRQLDDFSSTRITSPIALIDFHTEDGRAFSRNVCTWPATICPL